VTEKENSRPIHPWHPAWWLPHLTKEDRQSSCQRVSEASAPKPSYYVLIVLSTLIAGYGLVSNSTATVIGAMIVAPLMGPILGLALGTVLGDIRMFRRSLIAESTGVILVILTGMIVAAAVNPSHIDYTGSEIAGRTSPTLFDLAIGLAAGLAGAYCTVHPGLQASVAGVAIAVALVPPLAVTGLTGAGWLTGDQSFEPVFGSFMLFFTNLLTIELASGMVFLGTGFRHIRGDKPKEVWKKTWAVKTVLLLLTVWFLYGQLTNLFRERYGLDTSRKTMETMLRDIPGADLDSIDASLSKDVLTVRAVVGSRTDIEPPIVSRFQSRLDKAIKKGLPRVKVKLVIRTVNSTYASATGFLFEPRRAGLSEDERRTQTLDVVLRELLQEFPGVDLLSYDPGNKGADTPSGAVRLTMTLNTPYDFGPRFVKDLQDNLNAALKDDPLFTGRTYSLLVRSVIIKNATSTDAVAVDAPEMRTSDERTEAKHSEKLRALLTSALEINGDVKVLELHIRHTQPTAKPEVEPTPSQTPGATGPTPSPTPVSLPAPEVDSYSARVKLRSSKLVGTNMLLSARKKVETIYQKETGNQLELDLDTSTIVGTDLFLDWREQEEELPDKPKKLDADDLQAELSESLNKAVKNVVGARLDGSVGLQKFGQNADYRIFAVVTSPKPLETAVVAKWQKDLLDGHPQIKSLDLKIENRLGQTIVLTPIRRDPEPLASPASPEPQASPDPLASPRSPEPLASPTPPPE
jgi:uncharacterized hydrophobic protein (TIGR00271 family)